MASMTLGVAGAAAVAAGAYIDAKFHISKDLRYILRVKRYEREAAKAALEGRQSIFALWEQTVEKYPTARAIWSRQGCYTYREAHQRVLQYAGWLLSLGAQSKDSVALYASNSPEFVFLLMAMHAIGCYPALINYNLADASLVHCVSVAGAKLLIVDAEEPNLQDRVQASEDVLIQRGVRPVYLDASMKQQVYGMMPASPGFEMRKHASGNWPFALIYTSGTTGLPKAFGFETQRMYMVAVAAPDSFENRVSATDPKDREVWYDCMPLYHGTGLITGIGNLVMGMTLAIGKKFSGRSFWQDIHDSEATRFVYVGETARYLLAAPPSPLDRGHKVQLVYGNGLRPDVWNRFKERFGISEVLEFFTSTEGVFSTAVWERSGFGAGTVGHHGAIFRRLLDKMYVPVAMDSETNDMWRDPKTGFAKRVPYSQGGEIIVKLTSRQDWPGYHNNKDGTAKKFVTDVFEKGDVYYRPGDALRRDDDGLWYFMDRLGDTFRWKGENVSTAEVQEAMGTFAGLGEANVYGVEVPGSEGRAGCAAVILNGAKAEAFDWRGLAVYLRQKLPKYAVPIFIRVIQGDANAMGTHNNKQNKVLLRKEGVNIEKFGTEVAGGSSDAMYWMPPNGETYVPFGKQELDDVHSSRARL